MSMTTVSIGAGGIVHFTKPDFPDETLCGRRREVRYFKGRKTVKNMIPVPGPVECGTCRKLAEK